MADEATTVDAQPNTNPQTNNPNPPVVSPTPPSAPQIDLSPLLTQMAALPEQISNAVKEAVGTAKPPVKTETTATESKPVEKTEAVKTETAKPTPGVPTGQTRASKFRRMWWGDNS